MMKKLITIATLWLTLNTALAQVPKPVMNLKPVKDSIESHVYSNIHSFFSKTPDIMYISFMTTLGAPFSVNETHGNYMHIVICTKEYGDNEPGNVFTAGPFTGPIFAPNGKELEDRYVIEFTHGFLEKRKKGRISVFLDKVILK